MLAARSCKRQEQCKYFCGKHISWPGGACALWKINNYRKYKRKCISNFSELLFPDKKFHQGGHVHDFEIVDQAIGASHCNGNPNVICMPRLSKGISTKLRRILITIFPSLTLSLQILSVQACT
ncbi:Hypothetical predicted protein [Olea europaea subsp. europaea]|uniref:Uncharacterized protein n=1 Tax=Olea europaea subsp. europaea TaxID=158383 RepID=A0A8S0P690_OLEEU|nr:Hypothetical predicted protein [Olea europaea subsp. europaea]